MKRATIPGGFGGRLLPAAPKRNAFARAGGCAVESLEGRTLLAATTETFTGGKGPFTSTFEYFNNALYPRGISDGFETIQLTTGLPFQAVSLKLTHMGLDVDPLLAYELVHGLVVQAASARPKNFVRVDMEGSPYTQRTLDLVRELHRKPEGCGCVGAVIQSYMRRSEADIADLLSDGIRIRLCKGAYKEPPAIAYQGKREVDASYIRLMKTLLKSGVYHGLATHDESIIREAQGFVIREKIPREAFEFQMLYGIRRDLQKALVRDGWRMRVYVPFGTEWYPYLMRRLAERPANLGFVVRNMLRG